MNALEYFKKYYEKGKLAKKFKRLFKEWYVFLEEIQVVPYDPELALCAPITKEHELDVIIRDEDTNFLEIVPVYKGIAIPKMRQVAFLEEPADFATFLSETGKIFFAARDDLWYFQHLGGVTLTFYILKDYLKVKNGVKAVLNYLYYVHALGSNNLSDGEFFRINDELEEKISRFALGGKKVNMMSVIMDSLTSWEPLREFLRGKVPENIDCIPPTRSILYIYLRLSLFGVVVSKKWSKYLEAMVKDF